MSFIGFGISKASQCIPDIVSIFMRKKLKDDQYRNMEHGNRNMGHSVFALHYINFSFVMKNASKTMKKMFNKVYSP